MDSKYFNISNFFFFQAEDGIRDRSPSRGLGDVYKRQQLEHQDFVVIARKGVEDLSYQDIYSNLVHVLKIAKLYKD